MKLFLTIWRYVLVAVIAFCIGMVVQKQFELLNNTREATDEELQQTLRALTKQVERMSAARTDSEKQDVQGTMEDMIKQLGSKTQN